MAGPVVLRTIFNTISSKHFEKHTFDPDSCNLLKKTRRNMINHFVYLRNGCTSLVR